MSVLTIATADLRRLAGIDAADTSHDTALAAVVTAELGSLEYVLDPTTLAAAVSAAGALKALLTLGVAEQLAGSYLQQIARAPLALGTLTLGPLTLVPPSSITLMRLGDALVTKGTVRLAPYTTTAVANAAALAADKARAVSLATAKVTQAQATAADAAAIADAKKTKLQADAAAAADLDAARLAILQGQAATYLPEDTADNTALTGSVDTGGSAYDCEEQ